MPFEIRILGHRGEGTTNKNPAVYSKKLKPRPEPRYRNQILPENSLSAVEHALQHADGVEFDVFLSKDNVPMVIHDNQLARNVDGYHYWGKEEADESLGLVSDYTRDELQRKFVIGNDERIPALEEMIQLIIKKNHAYGHHKRRNFTVNIELKNGKAISRETYKIVKSYIDNPDNQLTPDDFIFNSFEPECIWEMTQLDHGMHCALCITTHELFGEVLMPGYVPTNKHYQPDALENLDRLITQMNLSSLDVVSADATEEMFALCAKRNISLNLTIIQTRLQYQSRYTRNEILPDSELEIRELNRLVELAQKYEILINIRTDDPGNTKNLLDQILKIKSICRAETTRTVEFLKQSRYDYSFLASFKNRMLDYQSATSDELGRELAKAYADAADQHMMKMK